MAKTAAPRMPDRKPEVRERNASGEVARSAPLLDLAGLDAMLADEKADRREVQAAIDRVAADPAAKETLSEQIRAQTARFGMSMELSPREMAMIQALVRLQDGPTVVMDGQLTDLQYARYREICTSRVTESLAESTGIRELLDTAARRILQRNAALLSTNEGIPLGLDRMHSEMIATVRDIDTALPASHPLKGLSEPLVKNFLSPPEDGKKLIRFAVERLFPSDSHDQESSESRGALYDTMAITVRWGVATLLDFAQSNDPSVSDRMRSVIAQMEKDPNIRAFTEQFPDFLDFFKNAPPQTLQTLDRAKTVAGLDGFLSSCRGDFLVLSDRRQAESPEKSQAASLHIANRWAAFLRELITLENADALVADISRLNAVRKNPMFTDLVGLVDESSGLSRTDRGMIANRLLEGMERLTTPTIDETGTFEYFDSLLADIGSLSEKISSDRLDRALASVVRPLMQSVSNSWPDNKSRSDVSFALGNDKMETLRLLWDNKGAIASYASARVRGETFDTVESVVRFIRENRVIQDNVRAAGGQLASRLRGMISGNVAAEIEKARASMLRSLPTRIRLPNEAVDANGDKSFQGRLASHVVYDIGELLRGKITGGAMDNQWNLTRNELVSTGIASARAFLSNNRGEAVEFLRSAGMAIRPGDEAAVGSMLDRLLAHPRFAAMIERIVANAGSRIAGAKDSSAEIRLIVAELTTQGADSKLVGPETRREALRMSVELLYDTVDKDPETAKKLFAGMGLGHIGRLTDKDVMTAAALFVHTIPRDAVIRALSPLADKWLANAHLSDLLSAGTNLLKSLQKDNKDCVDSFVDELRHNGIIARAMEQGPASKPGKPMKLGSRDIAEGVKLLYAFHGTVDTETFVGLPQALTGALGSVIGPGLNLAMQDISESGMIRALSNPESLRMINDALARRLDPANPATAERVLAFANRLYESVPDDRRAWFLAALADSGVISRAMQLANSAPAGKKRAPSAPVAITDAMIDQLSRFAYRTMDGFSGPNGAREFSARFGALARQAVPGMDVDALLSTQVMGAPLAENIHAVLSSLPPAEFARILKSHRPTLESMARGGGAAPDIEGIGVDIALALDPLKFRKAFGQRTLSSMERAAMDSMEALQTVARNTPDLPGLVREGRDIAATISRWVRPDPARLSAMSGRLFDFVAAITTRAPELLAAALSGGSGEGGGAELPVFSFVMSFVRNNFGYVFSNLFSLMFDRPKALSAYFTDPSNRSNFADTCVECTDDYLAARKKKAN